jgi:uncharacterized RDD family membrane protein YckC
MQCRSCLSQNPGGEERCQRCGKRLSGDSTFEGLSIAGATVLAPRRRSAPIPESVAAIAHASAEPVLRRANAPIITGERQPSLFVSEHPSNVIPFDSIQRPPDSPGGNKPEVPGPLPAGPATRRPVTAKQNIRKQNPHRSVNDSQGSLDLEFLPKAPQTPRTLKTTVEASIYCDAPVATPVHRLVAAFLDSAMILIGCGFFLGVFQLLGASVRVDRFDIIVMICSLILITLFYGFLFALSGRETPGQNWTELRLINFDGFPPDRTSRFLRFTGCWLSFSACGIGVLWSLLDEENLTWHDHMSKTFPTLREAESAFFRERAR